MINIGITIGLKEKENIWNNGIAQNVINFYQLLKYSGAKYNVYILNTTEHSLGYNFDGIEIIPIKEKLDDIQILFILGSQILEDHYNILRKNGCKIVYYSCGANYVLDMEEILFRPDTKKIFYGHKPDEIWVIPQNMNTNKHYFEILYRVPVKEIPFIWSPLFIEHTMKEGNLDCFYKPGELPKRISCFEPNLNVVKFAMYDILIVEQAYRKNPELIKHFYVTNAAIIKDNKLFIDIMKKLDVVNNKIATFEARYKTPFFLEKYTDVVVSHQWENPLNYAYLDVLYLNYPLIHNAYLIRNAGYYYDKFNVKEGADKLLFALKNHDKNIQRYNENSKKVLDMYLPNNKKSIMTYDFMIKNLIKK